MAEELFAKQRYSLFDSNPTSNQTSGHNSPAKPKTVQLSFNEERILRLEHKKIGQLLDMEADEDYKNDLKWYLQS